MSIMHSTAKMDWVMPGARMDVVPGRLVLHTRPGHTGPHRHDKPTLSIKACYKWCVHGRGGGEGEKREGRRAKHVHTRAAVQKNTGLRMRDNAPWQLKAGKLYTLSAPMNRNALLKPTPHRRHSSFA